MNDRVERFLGFNSEPGKGRRLTPPLASRGAGMESWGSVLRLGLGFNSEPGKELPFTRSLASRGAGIGCWEGVGFGG